MVPYFEYEGSWGGFIFLSLKLCDQVQSSLHSLNKAEMGNLGVSLQSGTCKRDEIIEFGAPLPNFVAPCHASVLACGSACGSAWGSSSPPKSG